MSKFHRRQEMIRRYRLWVEAVASCRTMKDAERVYSFMLDDKPQEPRADLQADECHLVTARKEG